jgi:hypothetical protein
MAEKDRPRKARQPKARAKLDTTSMEKFLREAADKAETEVPLREKAIVETSKKNLEDAEKEAARQCALMEEGRTLEGLMVEIFGRMSDRTLNNIAPVDKGIDEWLQIRLPNDIEGLQAIANLKSIAFEIWETQWLNEMVTMNDEMAQREVDNIQKLVTTEQEKRQRIKKAGAEGYRIWKQDNERRIKTIAGNMAEKYFPVISKFIGKTKFKKQVINPEFEKIRESIRQSILNRKGKKHLGS